MRPKPLNWVALPIILLIAGACSHLTFAGGDAPRMGKDALKARLGDSSIVILDVRTDRDWISSDRKIEGARRADPKDFAQWANIYPKDKTIVLYCA
jgi:hypothetical protein